MKQANSFFEGVRIAESGDHAVLIRKAEFNLVADQYGFVGHIYADYTTFKQTGISKPTPIIKAA